MIRGDADAAVNSRVDGDILYPLTEQLFGRWLVSSVTEPFVVLLNQGVTISHVQPVGKWMAPLESVQQWVNIARAVCVHGIAYEAKVAQRPWRDENSLMVCIYSTDDDRDDLARRIRSVDLWQNTRLEWKFDATTRRRLYGPESISYIVDPGSTKGYQNPQASALAFP